MDESKGENLSVDELWQLLDMGTKMRQGDKLFLSQEQDVLFGAVEFKINGFKIVGPDGTEFDLRFMNYSGENGMYEYLARMQNSDTANPSIDKQPKS